MKHIVTGIVAHVDAGKTTLSEALLYRAGALRKLGRVDNGDAFLDTDALEKQRGITIFSHQANLDYHDVSLNLLDTPGHVDFASQTEQVLSVLDYAILVVSATDGIQGYTRTLWRLLERYHVPTFIFVNKMDAVVADGDAMLTQLQATLSAGCVAFNAPDGENEAPSDAAIPASSIEDVAMQNDDVLTAYLETGTLSDDAVRRMISDRELFPVYFGAALKLTGVDAFMAGIERWTQPAQVTDQFGAKVFKITHDEQGERLTWLRLTGGELHPKDNLLGEQKVNQLRYYNGTRYTTTTAVSAGEICVVPGLTATYPGQGLGQAADGRHPSLQPVLTYAVDPQSEDPHACLTALRQLEDEDPQLHVAWSSHLQEIRVQVMGKMQLEVLQQLLADRFHLDVAFGTGSILYQETVTQAVEGVGHFEPLRHYAEVHLLIQPAPRGSGLSFDTNCSLETLGKNWQHQVMANLQAKEQLGVLVGAPLTDAKVTLVSGRASIVHSVGGDFREATWRALRQGLMMLKTKAACQLLEPWYRFRLEVGQDQVGRAMTDIQRMHGEFEPPVAGGVATDGSGLMLITGTAPVATMQDYSEDVRAYTHGQGQLECVVDGYRPCHDSEAVMADTAYQPVSDLENTPDSVFCAHGAGYPVAWDQVPAMAHVPYVYTDAQLAQLKE